MKKLLITLILFCLSLSMYSQNINYHELRTSVINTVGFIEILDSKDFDVISFEYEKEKSCTHMTLAYLYDNKTNQANTWIDIFAYHKTPKSTEIHIHFTENNNYNYLIDEIKRRCKRKKSFYNETVSTYTFHYKHLDGTTITFYEKDSIFHIVIFKVVRYSNMPCL